MYHSSVGNCLIIYDICSLQAVMASDPLEVDCDSSPCQKDVVKDVKVLTNYVISVSATTAENISDFSKIKGNDLLTEYWMMGIISTLIGGSIMVLKQTKKGTTVGKVHNNEGMVQSNKWQ